MLCETPVGEQEEDEATAGPSVTATAASGRHDGRVRIRRDGLMRIYVLQLLVRGLLELSFLIGQFLLYGLSVPSSYECDSKPCPHRVSCYVSR